MKTQETPKIHLEKVTWDNYWRVIHLQVSKEQRNFVATNTLSLAHAYLNTTENIPTWPFAIYFGKKIVGFTLLCYFGDRDSYLEDNPIPFIKSSYHISRLMIDRRHQRRGYGKEALQQILEFFRSQPAGPGEYVTLFYEMAKWPRSFMHPLASLNIRKVSKKAMRCQLTSNCKISANRAK